MKSTGYVRSACLSLVFAGLAGCGAPPQPSAGGGGKPGGTPVTGKYDGFNNTTKAFAAEFLKGFKEGKAGPAQLTAEFKRSYAPPELEAEKAQGYSDPAAARQLKLDAAGAGSDPKLITADGRVALFAARGPSGERTLLRVTGEPKVDWLSVGPKNQLDSPFGGAADAAQFTAMAFLDAVLTQKYHLAEGLLTDEARTKLGASVIDGQYNFGAFQNKLGELFGGATQYAVKSAKGEVVTVELSGGGKTKTAKLQLAAGRSPTDLRVSAVDVN